MKTEAKKTLNNSDFSVCCHQITCPIQQQTHIFIVQHFTTKVAVHVCPYPLTAIIRASAVQKYPFFLQICNGVTNTKKNKVLLLIIFLVLSSSGKVLPNVKLPLLRYCIVRTLIGRSWHDPDSALYLNRNTLMAMLGLRIIEIWLKKI